MVAAIAAFFLAGRVIPSPAEVEAMVSVGWRWGL